MQSDNEIWSLNDILHETFFFNNNYAQNMMQKLFPSPFLKNEN